MDGTRFDNIARMLAVRHGRRGFVLGAVGAALGLVRPSVTAAACPSEQVYRQRMGCVCKTTGRPATNGGCPCANGQYRCNGVCSRWRCAQNQPPRCSAETCPAPGICYDGACCRPRAACGVDECGLVDAGCGTTLDCGPCCETDCAGKQCGDDGCGGSCGECEGGHSCSTGGICRPPSGCSGDAECGGGRCCDGVCQDVEACPECATDDDCWELSTACALGRCLGGTCILHAASKNGERCLSLNPCQPGTGVCASGQCVADDKDCSHLDGPCAVAVCDPANGACIAQAIREGLTCGGPAAGGCRTGGTCQAGDCGGGTVTQTCTFLTDQCNDGVCDPLLGCRPQPKTTGTPCTPGGCYDENSGACQAGACTGGTPVGNGSNPASPGGGVCPGLELCSNGVCRICTPPGAFLTGGSCATAGDQCCGGCEDIDAGTVRCLA